MKKIFVFCLVFISVSNVMSAKRAKQCKTPRHQDGICISIRDCAYLYTLAVKHGHNATTPEETRLIQNSKCGKRKSDKVCCPPNHLTASDLPPPGKCGTQLKERIMGGTETSIVDYPWFALINYARDGQMDFKCGGTLINENYILTAAHCVRGQNPISVRLGEHNVKNNPDCEGDCIVRQDDQSCADPIKDVPISGRIVHEKYDKNSNANDLALLRLANKVKFTDWIRPVCLPFDDKLKNKNFDNVKLIVVGFGTTEKKQPSDVKKKLEIDGYNLQNCQRAYNRFNRALSSKMLCAGGVQGQDSCSGDSGGGLYGECTGNECINTTIPYAYIAGIVSFGPTPCGSKNVPGVYTRVNQYLDWILKNMKP